MIHPRLFLCSGAQVGRQTGFAKGRLVEALDSVGTDDNVHIQLENVARVFHKHLTPRLTDLLEIAAYVYTADCATNRGRAWSNDCSTEPWSRDFRFLIAVRDVEFWSRPDVTDHLCRMLRFMSDDLFEFRFVQLRRDRPTQRYFEFCDLEDWPFYGVERVVMFSGGLDSLAGAVESATKGQKLVLVSHRSQAMLSKRQQDLCAAIRQRWQDVLHVPVWINKVKGLGAEPTQRTRSFLYAALGAVIAESMKAGGVRFFENGIVSLNLPVADEVTRARASRTTHPVVLHELSILFGMITGREFAVDNPFAFLTKLDVVQRILSNGAGKLIPRTCSCAHTMWKSKNQQHCGTCSQCIDRRFAILGAGVENLDPEIDYASDVFDGPRKDGYQRNMAVDYVRHALELDQMNELEFGQRFATEISRATHYERKRSETAAAIWEMHRRHARNVKRVLEKKLADHASSMFTGTLPSSSLLALVAGQKHLSPSWNTFSDEVLRILQDSIPIICAKKRPENEPRFQEVADGVLRAAEVRLTREFPFVRWSCGMAKGDWSDEGMKVFIEAKYVRAKRDLLPISESIAADITKYGDNGYKILFVVYDPDHHVTDEQRFASEILRRPSLRIGFVR